MKRVFWILMLLVATQAGVHADQIRRFHDGYAVVKRGKYMNDVTQYGVINTRGDLVVPFGRYEWIDNYNDGIALCYKDGKYGYIGADGRLEIPLKFDYASPFYGDYAWVREGDMKTGKYYTINRNGMILYTFPKNLFFSVEGDEYTEKNKYLQPLVMDKGFAVYAAKGETGPGDNEWFLMSHTGKVLSKPEYDNPFAYDGGDSSQVGNEGYSKEDVILVSKATIEDTGIWVKWGVIDISGKTILPVEFMNITLIGNTISANLSKDIYKKYNRNPALWTRFTLDGKKITLPEPYAFNCYYGDPTAPYFQVYSKDSKRLGLLNQDFKPVTDFKYYRISEPDRFDICVGWMGTLDEASKDKWYDSDYYRRKSFDIICLADRSKDILNVSNDSYYNDGILVRRNENRKEYDVIDVRSGQTLYSLKKFHTAFDHLNRDVTVVEERNPSTREDEWRVRNRRGEIIYTIR